MESLAAGLRPFEPEEPPEVEARYTLAMYEALRALRQACEACRLGRDEVEAIFFGNAERLVHSVLSRQR